MSGVELPLATAAATGEASLAATTTAEAIAAAEAALAAEAAMAAETAASTATAMEAANAAAASNAAANPFQTRLYDLLPGITPGSQQSQLLAAQTADFGLSGLQQTGQAAATATGVNPISAAIFSGGPANKALANVGTNMAMQAMRPKQQTQVSQQLRLGNPQLQMNQVAGLLELAKRKRRPISLL